MIVIYKRDKTVYKRCAKMNILKVQDKGIYIFRALELVLEKVVPAIARPVAP